MRSARRPTCTWCARTLARSPSPQPPGTRHDRAHHRARVSFLSRACVIDPLLAPQSYVTLTGKHYAYSILWGMTVHSPVRQFFIWVVEWPWFDRTSLVLIIINVIGMMLSRPTNQKNGLIARSLLSYQGIARLTVACRIICHRQHNTVTDTNVNKRHKQARRLRKN